MDALIVSREQARPLFLLPDVRVCVQGCDESRVRRTWHRVRFARDSGDISARCQILKKKKKNRENRCCTIAYKNTIYFIGHGGCNCTSRKMYADVDIQNLKTYSEERYYV